MNVVLTNRPADLGQATYDSITIINVFFVQGVGHSGGGTPVWKPSTQSVNVGQATCDSITV